MSISCCHDSGAGFLFVFECAQRHLLSGFQTNATAQAEADIEYNRRVVVLLPRDMDHWIAGSAIYGRAATMQRSSLDAAYAKDPHASADDADWRLVPLPNYPVLAVVALPPVPAAIGAVGLAGGTEVPELSLREEVS